jgi:hypothetical protein
MHPLMQRVADAYRPLAGRNRLVEGPHRLPPAESVPVRRMSLFALFAAVLGARS